MRITNYVGVIMILVFAIGCKDDPSKTGTDKPSLTTKVNVPEFNADSAYAFIQKQVDFGPRVPNTTEHQACAYWLENKLKSYTPTVYTQEGAAVRYDATPLTFKNIIARFNPKKRRRVLLSAHWDTRFIADADSSRQHEPIDGANDGGSGVGVLLEIARIISEDSINLGVDIVLFDAEDQGQPRDGGGFPIQDDTWCLGSQYWAKKPVPKNYKANYGILLDMVGDKDAVFTKEGVSTYFAPGVIDKVWRTAQKLGYGSYFINTETDPITDDHLYINEILNLPTIDIIHKDPNTDSFAQSWHTHDDNMSRIDKNTLSAVGETVLTVLYYDSVGKTIY